MGVRPGLLLTLAVFAGGCINPFVSREPFPHPYVKHSQLPFSEGPAAPEARKLDASLRVAVCDFQSQATAPVGVFVANGEIVSQSDCEVTPAELADAVSVQLGAYGVQTLRLPGQVGNVPLMSRALKSEHDLALRGTLLTYESSQHGVKERPYDFCYMIVRLDLVRLSDGKTLWQCDVAAARKCTPSPRGSQKSLACDTARMLAWHVVQDAAARAALEGKPYGPVREPAGAVP